MISSLQHVVLFYALQLEILLHHLNEVIFRCLVNKWRAPIYECFSEGPANDCIFIAVCALGDYKETDQAKTKKVAYEMFEIIF